jgi:glycine/D-amino acid oxidase-like deaminating enzyme
MTEHRDVVVIGGGQTGLAVGYYLIWRIGWGSAGSSGHCVAVGVAGALAGRHERKVQSARRRGQTDIRGLDLKTRCSSRLAV